MNAFFCQTLRIKINPKTKRGGYTRQMNVFWFNTSLPSFIPKHGMLWMWTIPLKGLANSCMYSACTVSLFRSSWSRMAEILHWMRIGPIILSQIPNKPCKCKPFQQFKTSRPLSLSIRKHFKLSQEHMRNDHIVFICRFSEIALKYFQYVLSDLLAVLISF